MELQQPVKMIARWPGHGDLTIMVDGAYTYLRADDVERLADVPAWGAGETVLGEAWPEELDGIPFYPVDAAITKVNEHAGKETARQFLAWLDSALPGLLDPESLARARRDVGFMNSLTVRQAARTLDRDPAITIGQNTLFAHLEREGWITRGDDCWQPTVMARANGWVTIRRMKHPAPGRDRHASYEQVYITPVGMTQLRTTLRAIAEPAPVDDTRIPLFD
ncbi:phage antirepressor KilAC domain-containing protein [Microbacterium rhizophilus]|uniref:phage antirepressor KilAC domain-containing protein n=1 Tax=Microbacterium rhizophilus TaxID=3138934 RepID=UPI0031EAF841